MGSLTISAGPAEARASSRREAADREGRGRGRIGPVVGSATTSAAGPAAATSKGVRERGRIGPL
eukprot:4481017-Amphidinium_carterae.1